MLFRGCLRYNLIVAQFSLMWSLECIRPFDVVDFSLLCFELWEEHCSYVAISELFTPSPTATAVGYHTSRSLLRSFHTWRVRHRRAVDVAQFTGLLEEKGRAARLRRGLTQWKFCILMHPQWVLPMIYRS